MSRLDRLSARADRRLRPEQRQAVDLLRYGGPGPADRGEAKTTLGWRRTREETRAFARALLDAGMVRSAVADRLGVDLDYLNRVTHPEKPPRKPSIHAAKSGLSDSPKVITHPVGAEASSVYAGDPFGYDFEAALGRC